MAELALVIAIIELILALVLAGSAVLAGLLLNRGSKPKRAGRVAGGPEVTRRAS